MEAMAQGPQEAQSIDVSGKDKQENPPRVEGENI
jgi:hypothetical protein